jgi:nucleotide-binding universal stress UspA family protein
VKPIQKILFPIDLAADYKAIIPWVQDMANKFDATVCLLYVAHSVTHFPAFYVNINMESFQAEVQVAAKKEMAAVVRDFFRGFPKLETRVEFGHPAEKILAMAEQEKIDLIMMGTRGLQGMPRVILGSVAHKVVQSAPCPVMTIHP